MCIIFESKTAGGRAGGIPYIDSFPGLGRTKGTDFIKLLKTQVQALPNAVLHEFEPVNDIKVGQYEFNVITGKDTYSFTHIILATGVEHNKLNVTGEREFKGRGVSYCAACDGLFFRNKDTVVIGNDTHALEQALFLNGLESNVTLLNPGSVWNAEQKLCTDLSATQVKVFQNVKVEEIFGERMVGGVRISGRTDAGGLNDIRNLPVNEKLELEAKGVFISMGYLPRTKLVKDLGLELTEHGFIKTNQNQETMIKNFYAIGDLTAPDLELVSVCASGANAVKAIIDKIK